MNLIASPLLVNSADGNQVESIAAAEEAKLAVAGSVIIRDCLQGALSEYCIAMDRCAGEFDAFTLECETFAGQAGKLADHKEESILQINEQTS